MNEALTGDKRLVMVWSSADREVALKMVFMYTLNSRLRHWWEEVRLVVWGPAARLLAGDPELQDYLEKLKKAGVILEACKACSDSYEVSAELEQLGINVRYMGEPLSRYLQEGCRVLTF